MIEWDLLFKRSGTSFNMIYIPSDATLATGSADVNIDSNWMMDSGTLEP